MTSADALTRTKVSGHVHASSRPRENLLIYMSKLMSVLSDENLDEFSAYLDKIIADEKIVDSADQQ